MTILNFAPRPKPVLALTVEQAQLVAADRAIASALNIKTPRVIKHGGGRVCRVNILQQASAGLFGVFDCYTIEEAHESNRIILHESGYPPSGTILELNRPCEKGIVIYPGEGGIVSVSFN